jgi:short subunit dehydrogenase-like uncharacterized protein
MLKSRDTEVFFNIFDHNNLITLKGRSMSFLIYGASGYTGQLIVENAVSKGLKPVIAGRNESKIKPIAEHYGLEYVVFDLRDPKIIEARLEKFPLVLHCAGPFSKTAKPMVEACINTQTHYLDITGEIEVFELVRSYHKKALDKEIMLMPGVGFDVVPTDCVANHLKDKIMEPTHLQLAFMNLGGGMSHGTLMTVAENLGRPGAVREEGKIVLKPVGHKGKVIDFGLKKRFAFTIPWGDVSTAYHSTKIPNIEVYSVAPKKMFYFMKMQGLINPLLRTDYLKNKIKNYIDKNVSGPSKEQNEKGISLVWGKVSNAAGESVVARLQTPAGYALTADMAIHVAAKVLADNYTPGFQTPAGAYGAGLILEVKGTKFY